MIIGAIYDQCLELLKQLIATPSISKEEDATATLIGKFFEEREMVFQRHLNNIWCTNRFFDAAKPTILLNSHHDTVKPNPQYSNDPFQPILQDGKLFGLGSNDAGGCLVGLIGAFMYFYHTDNLRFNLVLAATAEEEISGTNGIESLLPLLPAVDFAIVGEPTQTNLAIAEKGLLVLDCKVRGKAGHAAREEGENAIYKALTAIEWFRTYCFPDISPLLGPVKMSVTVINTENKAHNVVPAECSFVVDVRVTEKYTHEKVLEVIQQHVTCEIKPRSTRLRSSGISSDHPIVKAGIDLGKKTYGSPTTSDKALIAAPSLKCGPGDSARSHTADEYIYLREIREGIETYIAMLSKVLLNDER